MSQQLLDLAHENERLKQEIAALRSFWKEPDNSRVYVGPRWWIALDEYELVNLREWLRAAVATGSPLQIGNSGDWTWQVLDRMEGVSPAPTTLAPNQTMQQYLETARSWRP